MNIFVTKLNYETQETTLKEVFEEFGEVSSVKIITDKATGRSKGYAFIEMPDDEQGENAIDKLNDTELDGRKIVVKKSEPKDSNNNRRYNHKRN